MPTTNSQELEEIIDDLIEDITDAFGGDITVHPQEHLKKQAKAKIVALLEQARVKARIDELKKAFDVDTIPGIPVKPCDDCIGIYEYTQDRIAELATLQSKQSSQEVKDE